MALAGATITHQVTDIRVQKDGSYLVDVTINRGDGPQHFTVPIGDGQVITGVPDPEGFARKQLRSYLEGATLPSLQTQVESSAIDAISVSVE